MATTTVRGHVSRALDFFERTDIYMGIGRTTAWEDEENPPKPDVDAKKLEELIGYKKLEYAYLVVPDSEHGTISYRDSKWRIVSPTFSAKLTAEAQAEQFAFKMTALDGLKVGCKIEVGEEFVTTVKAIDQESMTITVNDSIPKTFGVDTVVKSGALIEGARWVYVEAHLRYDELPLAQYRQIGVFARIKAAESVAPGKVSLLPNEVADHGIIEVVDNRRVVNRQLDQKEQLTMVIEF